MGLNCGLIAKVRRLHRGRRLLSLWHPLLLFHFCREHHPRYSRQQADEVTVLATEEAQEDAKLKNTSDVRLGKVSE